MLHTGLLTAMGVAMAALTVPAFAEGATPQIEKTQGAAGEAAIPRLAPKATQFTLDNGMEVVAIPDHRAPVATHMVWYKVGSADEIAGQSGIAHFLEHLMFKGTERFPNGEFSKIVAEIGGQENAFTSNDYTGYYQRVAKEHLPRVMEMEADRMTNLVLSDEQVTPERGVILEERSQRIDNDPSAQLGEEMSSTLFHNHPYGRPIIGWRHEIEALDRNTALDFYKRYYTPSNAILVIAGDVTPEEVKALAEKTYGQIPDTPDLARAPRPKEPVVRGSRTITLEDDKVRQPTLRRSYIAPSDRTGEPGEAEALAVLADVLGGSSTSRFYDDLVRGDGPATYAGAYYRSGSLDDTVFGVYALPKPGVSLEELEVEVDRVIADVAENGISEDALRRSKDSVIAQAIYSQDSQQTLARIVGAALSTGRTLDDVQTWPQRVQRVTAEEVRRAARKTLDKSRSVTGYLKPTQEG